MEKLQCSNGHWYDKSIGYCSKCKGGTELLGRRKTEHIANRESINPKPSSGIWWKVLLFLLFVIAMLIIFYDTLYPKPSADKLVSEDNISLTSSIVEESISTEESNTTIPIVVVEESIPKEDSNTTTPIVAEKKSISKKETNTTVPIVIEESNQTTKTSDSTKVVKTNSSVVKPTVVKKSDKSDSLLDIKKSLESKSTIDLEKHRYNFVGDK